MDELFDELNKISLTKADLSLAKMTTLQIGGKAAYTVYPETDVALDMIIRLLKEKNVPYKVIGKGSDLLCSDHDFKGAVIKLDRYFNDVIINDDVITAQAGESIIALAIDAAKHGLSGLEFAAGIPATVGGTVYMNAGAYRSCMADIIKEVFVYRDGKLEWMPAEKCEFSYRTSIFQKHQDWIILAVRLQMQPKDTEEIQALIENRRMRRMASQPLNQPSCGSVFRNPEGMNAWELIEGIGYRGHRHGGAEVSSKHCNFIVNADHATAAEYIALVEEIQQKVKEKYGVELKTEMEKFNW
ncbi:MAG: UDP-N-acetylmuramate dehydrogenase [Erysipelotrichaceae bacterium]|nr:UDP-N-acetylmuramate dehydrogenase [Erysipelotrichaceae bacterium]